MGLQTGDIRWHSTEASGSLDDGQGMHSLAGGGIRGWTVQTGMQYCLALSPSSCVRRFMCTACVLLEEGGSQGGTVQDKGKAHLQRVQQRRL